MGLSYRVSILIFAFSLWPTSQKTRPIAEPRWQQVDQLCGRLELSNPTTKTIVVDGKTETRVDATYVRQAELSLYRGVRADSRCCEGKQPIARSLSSKFGAFAFPGQPASLYWLRVQKATLDRAIPLDVAERTSLQTCREPGVGRILVEDSDPPTVQVRIY
jgi:hypothetical protein